MSTPIFGAGGKQIRATPIGVTQPDLTAQWEQRRDAIAKKQDSYAAFMQTLNEFLHDLIKELSQKSFHSGYLNYRILYSHQELKENYELNDRTYCTSSATTQK